MTIIKIETKKIETKIYKYKNNYDEIYKNTMSFESESKSNSNSNMSNFLKVFDFNEKFGVPIYKTPQPQLFTTNVKSVECGMSLIREEVKELEVAVQNHDLVETVDALADILYVVYGMGARFGIDMDKAFDLVHSSNMSKLCKNEDEAIKTVAFYKKEFEEGRLPYDSPNYRLSDDCKYYVVFNENTGKILKSINYNEVDLKECCKIKLD